MTESEQIVHLPVNSVMDRVEEQIRWYEARSRSNRHWYRSLKMLTIVSASLIPVVTGTASISHSSLITSMLGVMMTIIEGIQQVNQFHANWIGYRSICEALKREKYLYLSGTGPYGTSSRSQALFAERVESSIAQENTRWLSTQSSSGDTALR
jgi:hypothetical protein